MAKYNRLCVSISDETNNKLNSLVDNTNKRIKSLNKSTIVEIALTKFFEDITKEKIENEISKQIVVD